MILKQSTSYTRQFLMVSSADHVSGATGLNGAVTVYLSKAGAAGTLATNSGAGVTEVSSAHLPGIYSIVLSVTDVGTTGDLAFACTGAGADTTNFIDQVQTQTFTDLSLTNAGRVFINDNLQQNTALAGFTFMMVDSTTSQRKSGLAVTAQRTLGGGGFAPCSNSVSEIGATGIYTISLSAADLNNACTGILFTATGAADVYMPLVTTP